MKVLTIRSLLLNSFVVIIFAACGANAQKKAQICSNLDSEMVLPSNNAASQNQHSSHPMVLPKNPNYDQDSHPMVVENCSDSLVNKK